MAPLNAVNGETDTNLNCSIIHRVYCDQPHVDGEDHSEHPGSADFADAPRLFEGDHRASALRGQHPIPSKRDHATDDVVLVVRGYNCAAYHKSIRESFSGVPPALERQLSARVRPYACTLAAPGPLPKPDSEEIVVSQGLSTCLEEYTEDCSPPMGHWEAQHDLFAPYDYFYHFRRQLRDQCAPGIPQHERRQLLVLLRYIDETHGTQFDEIDRILVSGTVQRKHFSKLFAPNELVVTMQDDYPRAYIAESSRMSADRTISLRCWTWVFDGSFKKQERTIDVVWPQSDPKELAVKSLSAWPLRLGSRDLRERLVRRGHEFWKCRHRRLISYNPPVPTIFELQVTNPKYMVDYKTYRQIHLDQSSSALATEPEMQEDGVSMDAEEPADETFAILLPHTIIGYAFHDKKWRSLHVEHVTKVVWNEEAFSRLVLKQNKKDTIKALVSVHLTTTTVRNVDIVEDKGNGLIMLLHGSPGTGKTLTAESVAEVARKPLYRVTCGDVGTSAETVEKYLESVLLLGSIWECVVLLDEADYYDGILILTTNRVGTFDEAFKSRVQLAIHYPALSSDDRLEIWCNFIDTLRDKKVSMDHKELKRKAFILAQRPFNGRQIRNCLWTAAQVAKFRKEPLSYGHLEQIVEISQEFEDYLEKTRGATDEENAQDLRVRAFDHEPCSS